MRKLAMAAGVGLIAVGGLAFWLAQGRRVGLEWDVEPPELTAEASHRFSGQVRGLEASLTVDGAPLALKGGRFEHTRALQPGDNTLTFTLTARPKEGAAPETHTERHTVKRVDEATYAAETFYVTRGSVGSSTRTSVTTGLGEGAVEAELQAGELRGSLLEAYEHSNRPRKGGMPMEAQLSVGAGRVRVSLKPEEGPVTSAVASPGAPVTLRGTSELRHGKYHVRLEALEGPARDVHLRVRY
jgi:hypothetical protein